MPAAGWPTEVPIWNSKESVGKMFVSKVLRRFCEDNDIPLCEGECIKKVEKKTIAQQVTDALEKLWDDIALDLFIRCGCSWVQWQRMVNGLCSEFKNGRLVRALLPYGVKAPKLPKRKTLRNRLKAIKEAVGYDVSVSGSATADGKKLLAARLRQLIQEGKLITKMVDGKLVVNVQLLADACRLFDKGSVNATSVVLKVLWTLPGEDVHTCATYAEHVAALNPVQGCATFGEHLARTAGVNSVDNCTLIGFYLADDKHKDFTHYLPLLCAVLKELSEEGLMVDGTHYNINMLLGGEFFFQFQID